MKKRNSKIRKKKFCFISFSFLEEFIIPNTARVISAQLSCKNNRVLVSGDDKNNIFYWRFDKEKPLLVKMRYYSKNL